MIRVFILFALFYVAVVTHLPAQDIIPELVTNLDNEVLETSGLVIIESRVITHNDSGGEPVLYEIDPSTGNVTRSVRVANAQNTDWEDLSKDGEYLYIGDFGNNNGIRKDLAIYKVLIADYLGAKDNAVTADVIHFSYGDQTSFEPDLAQTPYDAEALVSIGDSLYIFTKNHTGARSDIYPVPKNPGVYVLHKTDSLHSGGLITGGTYDAESRTIMLTGYNLLSSFIINFEYDSGLNIKSPSKTYLLLEGSKQVESIFPEGEGRYMITTEGNQINPPALLRFRLNTITGIQVNDKTQLFVYPNPVRNMLRISPSGFFNIEIFSVSGQLLLSGNGGHIDLSRFSSGSYLIHIHDLNGHPLATKKLIVR